MLILKLTKFLPLILSENNQFISPAFHQKKQQLLGEANRQISIIICSKIHGSP